MVVAAGEAYKSFIRSMRTITTGSFNRITAYFLTGSMGIYLLFALADPQTFSSLLSGLAAVEDAPLRSPGGGVQESSSASAGTGGGGYFRLIFALLAFVPIAVFLGLVARALGNVYLLLRDGLFLRSRQRQATHMWRSKFVEVWNEQVECEGGALFGYGLPLASNRKGAEGTRDLDIEGASAMVLLRYSSTESISRLLRFQAIFFLSLGYAVVLLCALAFAVWIHVRESASWWSDVWWHSPAAVVIGVLAVGGLGALSLLISDRFSVVGQAVSWLCFLLWAATVVLLGCNNDEGALPWGLRPLGIAAVCLFAGVLLAYHAMDLRHRFLRYMYRITTCDLLRASSEVEAAKQEIRVKEDELRIKTCDMRIRRGELVHKRRAQGGPESDTA